MIARDKRINDPLYKVKGWVMASLERQAEWFFKKVTFMQFLIGFLIALVIILTLTLCGQEASEAANRAFAPEPLHIDGPDIQSSIIAKPRCGVLPWPPCDILPAEQTFVEVNGSAV